MRENGNDYIYPKRPPTLRRFEEIKKEYEEKCSN